MLRLSREKGESYMDYIERVCVSVDCMHVKLADIRHNTMVERTDEKARKLAPMYGKAFDHILEKLAKT
jgi:hypothetical protein